MISVLILFVFATLTVMAGITISNLIFFPHLRALSVINKQTPRVSVLIPARNEAAVIQQTLKMHLAQTYPNFEVLLLDDQSDDGTGDLARALNDPRLRVLNGTPLPEGWLGKNWACQQLASAAVGEILVFTDADVRWKPQALESLVAEMNRTYADLVTVWPTQITLTRAERLVVPLMALVIVGYLPIIGTHYTRLPGFAAANGQCMMWRRGAYQKVGGHTSVRDNVLEDVTLARIARQNRLKLRMFDGNHLISCRMYTDWPSVRNGYAKNILAGYGGKVSFLLLATVFHWLIFVFPWLLLIAGLTPPFSMYAPWAVLLVVMGVCLRMATAAFSRQRLQDSLLMPLSVILMTIIAFQSIRWHYSGGPRWKGRQIKKASPS